MRKVWSSAAHPSRSRSSRLVALILGPGLRMNSTLIVYAAIMAGLFNYQLRVVTSIRVGRKETLRAFGFGQLDVVRRVSLPAASPVHPHRDPQMASSIAIILNHRQPVS